MGHLNRLTLLGTPASLCSNLISQSCDSSTVHNIMQMTSLTNVHIKHAMWEFNQDLSTLENPGIFILNNV